MSDDLAERARSFGSIAEDYERWRPGVDPAVAEWFVPDPIGRAVDVGAGTGKLARLLVGRAAEVVCVEPDERMRAVLARSVPEATVLEGAGEHIPVEDASADAVLISSAWHWMNHAATAAEVARVLRPGGTLGVVWSGVDWTSEWFREVRARVEADQTARPSGLITALVDRASTDDNTHVLELPTDAPFSAPERRWVSWDLPMSADELVGLLGTVSGVIVLPEDRRRAVIAEVRDALRTYGDLDGDATVSLPFRADCWRARRTGG